MKACIALRDAVQIMVTAKSDENYRVKMDRVTFCLCLFRPEEFPERIRNRARMVLGVRERVAQEYPTDTLYHFDRLTPKQRRALEGDIIALYEACLFDLCAMGNHEFMYPEDRFPKEAVRSHKKKRSQVAKMPSDADPKPYPADQREGYPAEAKKLVPGDRIEFRQMLTPMSEDGFGPEDIVEYAWDPATVLEILAPAPGGTVMVRVRYDDGRERDELLARRWRQFSR